MPSASPMSLISNFHNSNLLVSSTCSKFVRKINMSYTYKHIMTHLPFVYLLYTHLSNSCILDPQVSILN